MTYEKQRALLPSQSACPLGTLWGCDREEAPCQASVKGLQVVFGDCVSRTVCTRRQAWLHRDAPQQRTKRLLL